MRREILIHFALLISFFIFISILRGWLSLTFWPLWVGGLLGTLLPDLDHILYIKFLKPFELSSQRASYMFGKRKIWEGLSFLAETRSERTRLIFHTLPFQVIFLILTFFVLTSSGSIFGRGLVLSFAFHLSVDQIVDIQDTGGLTNWLRGFPPSLEKKQAYLIWALGLLLVLLFGFFL